MSKPGEKKHRLATVMFVDVVGLNELAREDRELAQWLSKSYVEIQGRSVTKYRGRHLTRADSGSEKTGLKGWLAGPRSRTGEVGAQPGESVVEFQDASEAVECAVDIQSGVREHNRAVATRRELAIRIGLHTGEVVGTEKETVGEGLNVASQLALLAEDGGVYISEQVHDQIKNKAKFTTADLGKRNLKNVGSPVEVYRLVLPWEERTTSPATQVLDRKRVAVLPLVSLSPDPNDEFFADGMTEEMISTLSNISDLTVISRTSAMQYKGAKKNIADIGRELKAGTMLEGSIRKAGNRVRITVQLLDAMEDKHLWAQNYDRELQDVFAVQSDIAKSVADVLKIKLLAEDARQIQKKPTEDSDAFLLYLKGRQFWNKRNEEGTRKAIEYFTQATEHDPDFAIAHVGLADCYMVLYDQRLITRSDAAGKARPAALKALHLDDRLAEAHAAYAMVLAYYDWSWTQAESQIEKAINLNNNYASAHQWYSLILTNQGRRDEGLAEAMKALELDPMAPIMSNTVAIALGSLERYEEAIEYCKRSLAIDPNFPPAIGLLAMLYITKGEFDEARVWIEKNAKVLGYRSGPDVTLAIVHAKSGNRADALKTFDLAMRQADSSRVPPVLIAAFFAALNEQDKVHEWLRRALEQHDPWLWRIRTLPYFKEIRSSPEYKETLRKMDLDKY